LGGEVVLLVWVGNEGVVGCHHGDVEVDEVLEEGRLVGSWVTRGKLLIPMALYVPVGEDISRLVLFDAGDFNLLETPLRKVHVSSPEVAS